jgi:PTH2 family peptidyl-tRNA hydrolase
MDVKQVIVVRKDLNMRKGKLAAQVAHASMLTMLQKMKHERHIFPHGISYTKLILEIEDDSEWDKWLLTQTFKKIVVSVNSQEELLDICKQAANNDIQVALITDSGLTEFGGVPTMTCAAIGPTSAERIDKVTGHLPLL